MRRIDMNHAVPRLVWRSLIVATYTFVAACAGDIALSPTSPGHPTVTAVAAGGATSEATVARQATDNGNRAVDLGACTNLRAPAGSRLIFHVYVTGAQIYRWSGTNWVFVAPTAVLSADAGGHSMVGSHYAGPTWESDSGSTVVGTVLDRCTVSSSAIPWLSLTAVASAGPGIFDGVTFIQRVNTVGGTAPATLGIFVGEIINVPYTAEYYFYR
jgi:hypothetical protein